MSKSLHGTLLKVRILYNIADGAIDVIIPFEYGML